MISTYSEGGLLESPLPLNPLWHDLALEEIFAESEPNGFGTVVDAEFAEDRDDMIVNPVGSDAELVGDLLVRQPVRQERENLRLARRELRKGRIGLELRADFVRKEGFARDGGLDGGHELGLGRILEDGSAGATFEGVGNRRRSRTRSE